MPRARCGIGTIESAALHLSVPASFAAAAIIVLAYFIRGISGFGSGLIAVPLLAQFLPLPFVVSVILITDFSASLLMSRVSRRDVRWAEIGALLPAAIVGIVLGVTLLLRAPKGPLLAALGLFVTAFGIRSLLHLHGEKPISRVWAMPAGLFGGTIGALFGTGGPPYVIYLSHRLHDKTALRATFSGLFLLDGGVRIVTFIASGLLLEPRVLWAVLSVWPLMLLALYAGARAHVGLTHRQMQSLIGTLLLGSGLSLVWKAWA